jgi:hypothetical protein
MIEIRHLPNNRLWAVHKDGKRIDTFLSEEAAKRKAAKLDSQLLTPDTPPYLWPSKGLFCKQAPVAWCQINCAPFGLCQHTKRQDTQNLATPAALDAASAQARRKQRKRK